MAGKTVFDPTMGDGNLLASLVDYGIERGFSISKLPLSRLFGMEINPDAHRKAIDRFSREYEVDMTGNFTNGDVLAFGKDAFDVLFGNPPWCNFADLPAECKESLKCKFHAYGLIENRQKMLLGCSRIDIAALMIQKCIIDNLHANGKAVFFLPLSLFLNDGAHAGFRKSRVNGTHISVQSIYDFEGIDVFNNIATRCGLALFHRTSVSSVSVPYYRFMENAWVEHKATALQPGGPLLVSSVVDDVVELPVIHVSSEEKPRQGINPCGALSVFVFTKCEDIDELRCKVNDTYLLPKKFVYPLITGSNFRGCESPAKWVLLPYNFQTGKPLAIRELESEQMLLEYLTAFKDKLEGRKGTMLQTQIKRGIWWALLGVGKYSFAKYKIVWEAYGKNSFRPKLFAGTWQANQSLQAFIPCSERQEAERLLMELSNPRVEEFLLASRMGGTMSWAQPGRVSSLLQYENGQGVLFD